MENKITAKRCYHCGGLSFVKRLENGEFYVRCSECLVTNLKIDSEGRHISGYKDEKSAEEAWNNRILEENVPDCVYCEENEGNEKCPYFGEPDGCNNRELKSKVLDGTFQE